MHCMVLVELHQTFTCICVHSIETIYFFLILKTIKNSECAAFFFGTIQFALYIPTLFDTMLVYLSWHRPAVSLVRYFLRCVAG